MSDIDPGNACAAFTERELVELLTIAQMHESAGSPLLDIASKAGVGTTVTVLLPPAHPA